MAQSRAKKRRIFSGLEVCYKMPTFYEFFAGGGMARAGLGTAWNCLFANDIDEKKAYSYCENWGGADFKKEDVALLTTSHLPGTPNLVWASFPCQDLSLAGNYLGLQGKRSGTFWPFWKLMKGLRKEGRNPELVVLENVCGALTSHTGQDFRSIVEALRVEHYRVGAVVIDAALFVPQSRPRLFIVGVRDDLPIHSSLTLHDPKAPFHTPAIRSAYDALPNADRKNWVWWNLNIPEARSKSFADIIENDAAWHSKEETQKLLELMLPLHKAKVDKAKRLGKRVVGTVYKRTRPDENGNKAQRAEVRFDDIAGCLRTPGGGSSRQAILVVEGNTVRSRLLTPREAARLMGFDNCILPQGYNDAYRLMGDGVVVPVVNHLAVNLLNPLLKNANKLAESAA